MDAFVVSARKYRPSTFDEVVGQSHVTGTLKNAIKMGQLAHAFLFSGPRGVGKTTCARILAKAINCMNPPEDGEPCNNCDSCNTFNEGRSLNIHELDAASNNSVEDIRKIIEQVRYVPTTGNKSVFIIDEVHMLSQAAFNAFLKTLEEPPSHAIFILATTEKHKILPTILSRVQKFDFRRIKVNGIADHLKNICEKEEISFEYEALQLIGLKADGALRDALSIFDQIVSFSKRHITYQVVVENLNVLDYDYFFRAVDLMQTHDHEGMLLMLNEIIDLGFEARDFLIGLNEHFRNLLVARTPKTLNLLETSDNIKKRYIEQVNSLPPSLLLNAFNLVADSEQKMRGVSNPRLHIELCLVKLSHLQHAIQVAADLEKKKSEPVLSHEASAEPKNEKIGPGPVISADVPESEGSASEALEAASKKSSEKKVYKSAFNLPLSLDEVSEEDSSKAGKGEDGEEEEFISYDERVNIDPEAFSNAFETMLKNLTGQKNFRIASILRIDSYELDHNRWTQKVSSEIAKKQLNEERDLVHFMREKLGVPNLMLEIAVVEGEALPGDSVPYTNEQKLEAMLEKNPELRDFMKKFDTLVNY